MLLPSKAVLDQMANLAKRIPKAEKETLAIAQTMLEIDPQHAGALLVLAADRLEAGELAEAEDLLWRALKFRPTYCIAYLQLVALRLGRDPQDPLLRHLFLAVFRNISSLSKLPGEASAPLREMLPPGADLSDPELHAYCVQTLGAGDLRALNAGDEERFLPLRVLAELHWGARQGHVESQIVETFAGHSEACSEAALWALRSWARYAEDIDPDALNVLIAMLGEFGNADVIEDLWEVLAETPDLMAHQHWALCRLDDRFPAESLAEIRKRTPMEDLYGRSTMADHLSMMPRQPEVADALAGLLEEFADLDESANGSYLLAAVYEGLSDQGEVDRADSLLQRYKPFLSEAARKDLDELLFSAEGFTPALLALDLKEISLEDVLAGALGGEVDGEDGELDGDFEDEDGEWDEFLQPLIAPVRPGRNEPCWCGSGKKYKKCHLDSDDRLN